MQKLNITAVTVYEMECFFVSILTLFTGLPKCIVCHMQF